MLFQTLPCPPPWTRSRTPSFSARLLVCSDATYAAEPGGEINIPLGSCGVPGTGGQSTASAPSVTSASLLARLEQFTGASPLFTPQQARSQLVGVLWLLVALPHTPSQRVARSHPMELVAKTRQRGSGVCPRLWLLDVARVASGQLKAARTV